MLGGGQGKRTLSNFTLVDSMGQPLNNEKESLDMQTQTQQVGNLSASKVDPNYPGP